MAFQSYFTSRHVKKPAEGTQDFKKTQQIGILEHEGILAAILKNNCVWRVLITQLVKTSKVSHVYLPLQDQEFKCTLKGVLRQYPGKWFYKQNLWFLGTLEIDLKLPGFLTVRDFLILRVSLL